MRVPGQPYEVGTWAGVPTGGYSEKVGPRDADARRLIVERLQPEIDVGRFPEQVRSYCTPLREAGVDTVILGCTHYPLVRPMLQRFLGRRVEIVSSGAPVARQVEHVLGARGLGSPQEGEGDYSFLCTGDAEVFHTLGTRFLQLPLGDVETLPSSGTSLAGSRP